MPVATKRVSLTKVQALAATYVFSQLEQARVQYDTVETRAKNQFAEVLMEVGVDPTHVSDARFESGPTGAWVEYDEEVVAPAEPIFEKPPVESA